MCLTLCNPWTSARQPPLSMEFSRQEYWSGLRSPSPGHLPNPGIKPGSPTLQADSLLSEPPGKTWLVKFACNAGNLGLIPGLGRSTGKGNGNPLKYCLENPMDRKPGRLQSLGHKELDTTERLTLFYILIITTRVVIITYTPKNYLIYFICIHNILPIKLLETAHLLCPSILLLPFLFQNAK